MKFRKFQISCPVFWGYNKNIDIESFNSIDEIIKEVLDSCEDFFKSNNLIDLFEYFKTIKDSYHIHDITLEMMHNSSIDDVFYICRHENCNNHIDRLLMNRHN